MIIVLIITIIIMIMILVIIIRRTIKYDDSVFSGFSVTLVPQICENARSESPRLEPLAAAALRFRV